jgi:predicted PurR-regulated permease PerM
MAMLSESDALAPSATPRNRRIRPTATAVQVILLVLAMTAFLYWARPVILPVVLAFMAAAALRPLVRLLSRLHVPAIPAALIIFVLLVSALVVGFVGAGRPAMTWVADGPEHVTELQNKIARLFPSAARLSRAISALDDLSVTGEKKDGQKKIPTVQINDLRAGPTIVGWTGMFLGGLGEVIVLVYLLLASEDMFLQKLVRIIPLHSDKKRAIDISHEVQAQVSNYLSSVLLINLALGAVAWLGFYYMGVPRAGMWGIVVVILNFVPYFGPIVGITMLLVVGLISFDSVSQAFMPFGWYLLIHLIEANFVTPILLGRRFTLNPVAIFISLMFWFWLWGVPGALLSVPILVSVKAVCDRLPRAHFVSEFISR